MKAREPADDSPLGTFEEQVMLAVIRTGDNAYAMNIRRELEEVTSRSPAIGSIYVTLDRLEAKGLILSRRAQRDDSISRRLFVVTAAGARALAQTRAMRDRLWEGVELRRLLRNT
jgi:PadR family transcriptional regulator, regulatory protein PadR